MSIEYTIRKFLHRVQGDPFRRLRRRRHRQEDALREEFHTAGLRELRHGYGLFRIIGNDLPPRHDSDQTPRNLEFTLQSEGDLEHCEKRWIINRIVDPKREQRLIDLLASRGQRYERIGFDPTEYCAIGLDYSCLPDPDYLESNSFRRLPREYKVRLLLALYRLKSNYLMNVNGARNLALRIGKKDYNWVLPWDGSCFVTGNAWHDIRNDIETRPHFRYFLVPMARAHDNAQLLRPNIHLRPIEEPQLIFRHDSTEEFDERFTYGRRPKLELFWRLKIPGAWQGLDDDPWDLPRNRISPDFGNYATAGWVARLASGEPAIRNTSHATKHRLDKRQNSIINMIRLTDRRFGIDTHVEGLEP